jgi:uncharacterized protein YbaP (TraB family)
MRKFVSLFVLLVIPTFCFAQEPQFMRLKKDKTDKILGMEIAITKYTNKDVTVELIGVVHIADTSYYNKLSNRFKKADVVLYELVAEPGAKPEKKKKSGMYNIVAMVLDLDDQMSAIDYHKSNFVHADLSFSEMMAIAKKRGDTPLTLGLSVLVDMLKANNLSADKPAPKTPDINFEDAISNPNLLKRQFAAQMMNSQTGPTLERLLITDRNKAAMKVMEEQIAQGKKKLVIFYGAAHCPDFHKRLTADHGMTMGAQEWLLAWDTSSDEKIDPALRMLKILMQNK